MCGIAGMVPGSDDTEIVSKMCAVIAHRGPDDSGFFASSGSVSMGMRRLSIIDVDCGHQPIFGEDRSVAVVFNGEIYNFQILRDELRAKGHTFTTRSDTEVIVHGYEEFGHGIFSKLDGMFAIALWDGRNETVTLARDRMGIKPLYFWRGSGTVIFASEVKCLLQHPKVAPQLDHQALEAFLTYQYSPSPQTLLRGVVKLPPGHYLTVAPRDVRQASPVPFWQFNMNGSVELAEDEAAEQLALRLEEAVRSHLMSEVPVGAFLSGGIDSSLLVALASRCVADLKTFTVTFPGTSLSEAHHARTVARYIGTDHHEIEVSPDLVRDLPRLVWHMDEPLGDPAALPTYFVSAFARSQGVKVALSGEGADELFGGYEKYHLDRYLRWYHALLPRYVRASVVPSVLRLLPRNERLKRLLLRLPKDAGHAARAVSWRKVGFPDHYRKLLLSEEVKQESDYEVDDLLLALCGDTERYSRLSMMLYLDTVSWLPDDLLMKVDRMSMAASLEARVPYLSNGVVEFASRLPDQLKIKNGAGKYLLKKVASRYLPPEIVHRQKHGFKLPLSSWIRGDLNSYFRELILEGRFSRTLLNLNFVESLFDDHCKMRADHADRLWLLANLNVWTDQFAVRL